MSNYYDSKDLRKFGDITEWSEELGRKDPQPDEGHHVYEAIPHRSEPSSAFSHQFVTPPARMRAIR